MPAVPSRIDGPVAVIGDVHGQTEKLRRIIGQIARLPDVERRWIVFLGDLVDRGPDPAGTVQLVCDLMQQHSKVTWVCGNHELAMAGSLGLLPTPDFVDFSQAWVSYYLSEPTFQSYGTKHGDLQGLRQALPEAHVKLLSDLPWSVEHSSYLFVHAGLDKNLPFDTQVRVLRERDYSLGHPPWMYSKDFILAGAPADSPVPIVVGHVPIPKVQFQNGMIALDTGSGDGGPLSCVLLPENVVLSSEEPQQRGPTGERPAAPRVESKRPWWRPW
jgi:serine/threonine protein phosphatase 1